MSSDQINSLIWGNFESEILEMEIPLWTSRGIMKTMAMDGAFALFNGFLTFLMYKLGYKPRLNEKFKVDLDDNSWWRNNLDDPSFTGISFNPYSDNPEIPAFVFKQFVNKIGKDITICILLDWYTFYECGLALKESKLDEESKYSDKIIGEFKIGSEKTFHEVLEYFRDLRDKDFAQTHKLVLRPDKFVDYVIQLDETYTNLGDFPQKIIPLEEWNTMTLVEKIGKYARTEIIFCTENNYEKLLEKASIEIPNVDFLSFNEFIKDKLVSSTNEWEHIRDGYIVRLKNSIKEPELSKDFSRSKKFLQNARDSFENHRYSETVMFASNAIEDALDVFLKTPKLDLRDKIFSLQKNKHLRKHVIKLNFIRGARNFTVHPNDLNTDEDTARQTLEMADQFLVDIQRV